MKRLAILFATCFAALATVALAHHILAIGSHGRGFAVTHSGRVGSFYYSVIKRTATNHPPQFEGSLQFQQNHTHAVPGAVIRMGRPTAVAVNGTMSEFAGPGSLTRLVKGHHETVHGQVSVFVNDRRNPHHTPHNPPDVFRIHFTDNLKVNFIFEGLLHSGDLAVFSRLEH